jgi:integrase
VNRELACLSKLLRKAVEWHYLKINPMTAVKLLKQPPGRLRYLEPEEIDALYGALEDLAPWLKPIVQVALLTGMRRNEILTLSWNHVTLRDAIVTLPQTKNNDLRVVPLSREAWDIFAAVPRHVSHEFVFVNAGTGRPWAPFYVSHTFARVGQLAGIPNCRFDDLRHTFASHVVMRDTDLKTVQQLLGHRDIRMTLRYAHLSQTHLRESVEKLSVAYWHSDNLVTSARHQTRK